MNYVQIYDVIAPDVGPDTTPEVIGRGIREVDPDVLPGDFWKARDKLCRLAADRCRIAARAGSWTGPPDDIAFSYVPRWSPLDPPSDRGRRVIRKAGPLS